MSEPRLIRLDGEQLSTALAGVSPSPASWVRGARDALGAPSGPGGAGVLAARLLHPERLLGRLGARYPRLRDDWRQVVGENLINGGGAIVSAGPEHVVVVFADVETALAGAVLVQRLVGEVWRDGLTPETALAVDHGHVAADSRRSHGEAIDGALALAGLLEAPGILVGESAVRELGALAADVRLRELAAPGSGQRVFAVEPDGGARQPVAPLPTYDPQLAPELERERLLNYVRRAPATRGSWDAIAIRSARALGAALERGDLGRTTLELQCLAGALAVRDPAEALRLAAAAQRHQELAGIDLSGSPWSDWLDERLEPARANVGYEAAERLHHAGASLELRDAALRAFRAVAALGVGQ